MYFGTNAPDNCRYEYGQFSIEKVISDSGSCATFVCKRLRPRDSTDRKHFIADPLESVLRWASSGIAAFHRKAKAHAHPN